MQLYTPFREGLLARHRMHLSPTALMELIWFLLIGLIAGWLADMFVKNVGFGLIGDMIVGMVGALVGGYLFSVLGISAGGLLGQILMAFVGAVLLLLLIRAVRRHA